jgi:hypothetical protein
MATLRRDGDELVVELTAFEQAEALHGDIRVPAWTVSSVEVVDDAIAAVHGLKLPGTAVPGLLAVGTFRLKGSKVFAVVHHDTGRGVRVVLDGADYTELVIGCHDPEAVVAALRSNT